MPAMNAMVDALPGAVGPGEAEGKVRLSAVKYLIKRHFQQSFAVAKPIVPITETCYPAIPGKGGLCFADFGYP